MIGGDLQQLHRDILDELSGPGSMTKDRLVEALTGNSRYTERAVKVHLADLITEGYVEEPDGMEDVYTVSPDAEW